MPTYTVTIQRTITETATVQVDGPSIEYAKAAARADAAGLDELFWGHETDVEYQITEVTEE